MDILSEIERKIQSLEQNKSKIETKLTTVKNNLIADTGSYSKIQKPNYSEYLNQLNNNNNNYNNKDLSDNFIEKTKKKNEFLINNNSSNLNKIRMSYKEINNDFHKVECFSDLHYQESKLNIVLENTNYVEEHFYNRNEDFIDDMFDV